MWKCEPLLSEIALQLHGEMLATVPFFAPLEQGCAVWMALASNSSDGRASGMPLPRALAVIAV